MSLYDLSVDEKDELAEVHQERMCALCELNILGCSKNTIHFQCEGSKCDSAIDYLIDELENERIQTEMYPIF